MADTGTNENRDELKRKREELSPYFGICVEKRKAMVRWRNRLIAELIHGKHFSLILDETGKNNRKIMNLIAVTANSRVLIDTKVVDSDVSIDADVVASYNKELLEELCLSPATIVEILPHT